MSDLQMGKSGPKKAVSRNAAIAIMSLGGFLFAISIVVPTTQGTKAQFVKICVGAVGLTILCVGAYLRPMKMTAVKTKA